MATRADVARAAGVSESTVSYALSGSRPISAETRERIFDAMRRLDYTPNALARGLASRRTGLIAVAYPVSERGLAGTDFEYLFGASERARGEGFHAVLWSTPVDDPDELRELVGQGLVEGVLLMEVMEGDPRVAMLRQSGIPFALVGRTGDDEDLSYVDSDFDAGGPVLADYLAGLGHRQVAFYSQSQAMVQAGYGPVVRMERALARACADVGIELVTLPMEASMRAGREAFETLIEEHPGVTAVLSMNEPATAGLMQAVGERGWRIPRDISVISPGLSASVAQLSSPTLTTLAADASLLGGLGMEAVLAAIRAEGDAPLHHLQPMELSIGGSSGQARTAEA